MELLAHRRCGNVELNLSADAREARGARCEREMPEANRLSVDLAAADMMMGGGWEGERETVECEGVGAKGRPSQNLEFQTPIDV